jgi:hypothetical protein
MRGIYSPSSPESIPMPAETVIPDESALIARLEELDRERATIRKLLRAVREYLGKTEPNEAEVGV